MTKKCRVCEKVKPISEFYLHSKFKYQSDCKDCQKYRMKLYNRTDKRKEYNKLGNKKWQKTEKYKAYYKKRREDPENVFKAVARCATTRAIKKGLLTKMPCEVCGSEKRIQAHHTDYSKPLEIVWLCSICHKKEHSKKEKTYGSTKR